MTINITDNGSQETPTLRNRRYAIVAAGTFDSGTLAFNFFANDKWVPFRNAAGSAITATADAYFETSLPGNYPKIQVVTSGGGGSMAVKVEINEIEQNTDLQSKYA